MTTKKDKSIGARTAKWIDKYGSYALGKLGDGLTTMREAGDDAVRFGLGAVAKAPGNLANIVNEVAIKGIGGNAIDLVTGLTPLEDTNYGSDDNFIDKGHQTINKTVDKYTAENATTEFAQEHSEGLQTIADVLLPIPGVSKIKVAQWAKMPKWMSFLSKDKQLKKSIDALKKYRATNSRLKKGGHVLSEAEQAKYLKEIAKLEGNVKKYTTKASDKYNKTPDGKINKVDNVFAKDDKAFLKTVTEKKPNFIQRNPKKSAAAGVALLAGNELLGTGSEDDALTEELGDADPLAGEDTNNSDTPGNENTGGDDLVPTDNGETIEEEQALTDAVNNDSSGTTSTSSGGANNGLLIGNSKNKRGQLYNVYFRGGSIYGVGPDGNSVLLITGVNNSNKNLKYEDAAAKILSL